ncbi:MAG TPA: hypothetical protein VF101_05985 [Gaiellaceae bacterium]
MYPTHHFHQEFARARYADMLREARMTNVEPTLEAELGLDETKSFARVRRLLAHRPWLAVRREPRLA